MEYRKCKFGNYCKFSHVILDNPETIEKIKALEKEVEDLELEIKNMKKVI